MEKIEYIFSHFVPCVNRDKNRTFHGVKRNAVLEKFNKRCAICYREEVEIKKPLQIHHIFPYFSGGPTIEENVIPLCYDLCHPLADLGAWSPEYLYEINKSSGRIRIEKIIDLSDSESIESAITKLDADNLNPKLSWDERISKLIDNWTSLSRIHAFLDKERFIELSAKLIWSISKVITTYVPEKNTNIYWRKLILPFNRIVGIYLAEKARILISRFLKNNLSNTGLIMGMTRTISTHYRSSALKNSYDYLYYKRALNKDKKYMKLLLEDGDAELGILNHATRAYYLIAYCIDLAELKRPEARSLINKIFMWARNSGSLHSISDTLSSISEIELRLGNPYECINVFEKKYDSQTGWELIQKDIPIVQVKSHKILMQAYAMIGNMRDYHNHFISGYNIAIAEKLEDQKRKIESLKRNIENEKSC